ncbi:MAG: methionyl-tRNA formyltransferase [Chloroflexi bacterium]|nr:methionyl-tRNA formyltransferase [Chloroflexota bacterium]
MRLVYMGTPDFAVPALQRLIDDSHDIVAVYTQPDKPGGRGRKSITSAVKKVALKHGLNIQQPLKLRDPSIEKYLLDLNPDIIIVASYGQILPKNILNLPKYGSMVLHPSLLPKYRGPSPISSAILAGDEYTGCSIILMEATVDTGPVLAESKILIGSDDNTTTLSNKLANLGADMLVELIPHWTKGEIIPRIQNHNEATMTRMFLKEDGKIDWNLSAVEIWRRVRAFNPWPGTFTIWQGKTIKVIESITVLSPDENLEHGTVIKLGNSKAEAGVITGNGILGLITVQLEGKKPLSTAEFLRGYKNFIGSKLI